MASCGAGVTVTGTVVEAGATLDLGGNAGANGLILGAEQITVSGAGVNGRGAIINSSNVSQYNAIQGDPAFASQSQTLASMMTQPKAYTATAYQSILNSLTPQQRLVIQATNPGALTMSQSLFASANSLAGGTPSNQKGLDAVAGNYFGPTNPYYGNVGGSDNWDPFSIAGRLTAGIG